MKLEKYIFAIEKYVTPTNIFATLPIWQTRVCQIQT